MLVHLERALRDVAILLFLCLLTAVSIAKEPESSITEIRIGWQVPTVTQAALVQVLKRTDVLARHGLEPSLIPYSYGTPEVADALAGKLDIFFAGDQPAINLMAQGGQWKIVARVYTDRVSVIVPPNSPIDDIAQLRGKTVASSYGSIAHREVFLSQGAAGLDVVDDVNNVDMDILDIRQRILSGGGAAWESFDAAAVWEPDASIFRLEGRTRSLGEKEALGVLAMSEQFIAKNPDAAVQLLVAIARAWDFFSRDPGPVIDWYIEDTLLGYSHEALIQAVSIDRNFEAGSLQDIDMALHEEHIRTLETNAAWGADVWETGREIRQFVDQDLLKRAMEDIRSRSYGDLKVILPSVDELAPKQEHGFTLYSMPLVVIFVFMVAIALLAIESGFWFGKRHDGEHKTETDPPISTVVGAVLGMMAFVIALTFSSASTRFDARKAALLEDVTAIQTAYLRADLLPEPQRTTLRNLLRDYVQVRVGIVDAYGQADRLELIQRRALALQATMWSRVHDLAADSGDGRIGVLFASALNDVFNQHSKRVGLGAHYQIPDFVWWTLICASSVAMVAVGFQFGVGGGRRIHTANFSLAITFALVMLLAFDLDRAGEGLVVVNQQPMLDLYRNISMRY